MATEKEFKLIGSFQDNITAKLRKLNREINTINKSFQKMQSKLRPIARDMGTIAMASERVTAALKGQRSGYQSNISTMRAYRAEMGKTVAAAKKLSSIRPPRSLPVPTLKGATMPRGGGASAAVSGGVIGMQVGNLLNNSVVKGFQIGTDLMKRPFTFLASSISERIGDEMSDIQSAGGMFALDQKKAEGERLFRNFAQAREFQEDLNRSLAKSAAALPGATSDYVRAAKGLTDTVMMAFGKNEEAFKSFAKELGAREGATSQEALTKVLQRFTEQTVLLGQGSSGGMPLTMLMEQLIQREQVSVQGMRMRYVQLRDNPLLASMLEEAQNSINATAAGSAERFAEVMKALDRALPQEVINSMRNSISGVQEAIRSGLLDPEAGLLGLGRELNVMVTKYDEFGKVVVENGKVVKEQTTIFKMLRDTLAGFGLPIAEVISILPKVFDPLEKLASAFVEVREISMNFLDSFTRYTNFFKQANFEDAGALGALAAFNKLLRKFGAISFDEALANAKLLETKGSDLGGITKRLFEQLMGSEFMGKLGTAIGSAVGGVLDTLAKILGGAKDMATAGPFAKGFSEAFGAAGGPKAITAIIKGVFETLGKAIVEIVKAAPMETAIVASLAILPSVIASAVGGMVTAIVGKVASIFSKKPKLPDFKGAGSKALGAAGKQTTGAMQALPGVKAGSKAAKALATGAKMKGVGLLAAGAVTMATHAPKLAKVGKAFTSIGKKIPGLNVAFAGLDFALQKMSGESTKKAAASAGGGLIGSVIGGAIGTAIAPGIGTAIGSVLGGFIGDWVGQRLPAMLAGIGPLISKAWSGFTQFISDLPGNLMWVIGYAVGTIEKGWSNLTQFVFSLPGRIGKAITSLMEWFQSLPGKFKVMADNFIKNVPNVVGIVQDGLGKVTSAIINWVKGIPGRVGQFFMGLGGKFQEGRETALGPNGGSGTRFKSVAEGYGLQMTSFMRPGDQGSYHSIGRAMDFSNSTGPTTEMMAFAQHMVDNYGSTLKELIYTPLGFSVKDGRMVAPMSPGGHYNHVHVAWNKGNVSPLLEEMKYAPKGSTIGLANSSEAIFNKDQTALLANALKGGRGDIVINGGIHVTGVSDSDEAANSIAGKILNAIRQSESSTIA